MDHFLATAKAYAALVGAIVTSLLATQAPGSTIYTALTVVSVITTAIVTFRVPNKTS